MIDIKDLQIGNWVMTPCGPHQIDKIYDNGKVSAGLIELDSSKLNGIPITPEILKRNGFILTEVGDNGIATPRKNINRYEKHECKTKWRDIIMWYDRITKKWYLHGINSIQLNYVHQLQHALRFCEIDKEIKI